MIFTTEQSNILAQAGVILEDAALYKRSSLTRPAAAKSLFLNKLADSQIEIFAVAFLNAQNQLIEYIEMFTGTLDQAQVYPREIAKKALEIHAGAIIIAHNHPSGNPRPSLADIQITEKIKTALALFDIRVIDHIVVGHGTTESFAELGHL